MILFLLTSIFSFPQIAQQIDWEFQMPHARNQGNQGSCVSFALSYLMTRNICLHEGWDPKYPSNQFSPAFIHNQFLQGAIINLEGLKFLVQNGICLWNDFPYDETDETTQPNICTKYNALKYKLAGWDYTSSIQTGKYWLYFYGPILTNINYTSGTKYSICLVGYDDNKIIGADTGAFKYINSFGENWGENGYEWLPYNSQTWQLYRVIEYPDYEEPYYAYQIEWNMADFNFNYNHLFSYLLNGSVIKIDNLNPVFEPMINNFMLPVDVECDEIIYQSDFQIITSDSTTDFEIYNVSRYLDGQQEYVYYDVDKQRVISDTMIGVYHFYIKIYLTIFDDKISIRLYEPANIKIVNLQGIKILELYDITNKDIYLSNLKSGLYLVVIQFDNGIIYKKIIKN